MLRALRFSTIVMLRRRLRALRFGIAVILRRGLRTSRLSTAVMPGRELQVLHLGYYGAAGTQASTLASWYCTDVEARAHVCVLALHEWL